MICFVESKEVTVKESIYHLRNACLGSVSEILEGDPPHLPRGAIAQAWSVAEVLRLWRKLDV